MTERSEFSRRVPLDRIGFRPHAQEIAADAQERQALAARLGLVAIDELRASVTMERSRDERAVRLSGRLTAQVVQSCVVSLEPVPARVEEEFAIVYADATDDDTLSDPGTPVVEPLPGDAIDIGEATAQQLSLALDPYPRSPAARLEPPPEAERTGPAGPFAALAKLKPSGPTRS